MQRARLSPSSADRNEQGWPTRRVELNKRNGEENEEEREEDEASN